MRVMHLISACAPGGAEIFVRDLSLEILASGHQCAVAYLSSARHLGSDENFELEYLESLSSHGIDTFLIGHSARRNPLRGMLNLFRSCRKFRPDILHVHLARGLLIRALLPLHLPTVFTWHSTIFKFDKRLFYLFDLFVDQYVAICNASEPLLRAVTRRDVEVIHNGIPAHRISPGEPRSTTERLTFISAGSLTLHKNYPLLINTARLLRDQLGQKCPQFLIAGEGPELAFLKGLIEEFQLGGVVELLGMRSDIGDLMARADAYLLTSQYEGFPISLLEALRSGLPIIAKDVGGVNEIVTEGQNGFLIADDSSQKFAERIARIHEDRGLLKEMSYASSAKSQQFGIDQCAQKHQDMYSDLLGIIPVEC